MALNPPPINENWDGGTTKAPKTNWALWFQAIFNLLKSPSSASAYASVATSLVSATPTKVLFQTLEWDANNEFSSSRFTPATPGYYQVNACVQVGTAASIITSIYKNGVLYKAGESGAAGSQIAGSVSALVSMNGGDYIEIYCTQGGLTQNCVTGAGATYFQACVVARM